MGGYFIVNGIEKVIRMLIMPRRNYPIAMSRPKWKSRGQGYTQYGKCNPSGDVQKLSDSGCVFTEIYIFENGCHYLLFLSQVYLYIV